MHHSVEQQEIELCASEQARDQLEQRIQQLELQRDASERLVLDIKSASGLLRTDIAMDSGNLTGGSVAQCQICWVHGPSNILCKRRNWQRSAKDAFTQRRYNRT